MAGNPFEAPGIPELLRIMVGEQLFELIEWAAAEYDEVVFRAGSESGTRDRRLVAEVLAHGTHYQGVGGTPWEALCAAIGQELQAGRDISKAR